MSLIVRDGPYVINHYVVDFPISQALIKDVDQNVPGNFKSSLSLLSGSQVFAALVYESSFW